MNGSALENELIADGPQVHQAEVSKQTNEEVEEQEMLAMVSEFECTDLLENSVETATARITQCMGEGVGAVMVSQPTAFLTESGFEADQTVAAGLHQVAITHQAHQELSSADQTAVTELTTCFAEDLPQSLPGLAGGTGVAAASSTVSSLPTASDCSAQVCFDNNHNWLWHEIGAAMDNLETAKNDSINLKEVEMARDQGNWDEWNFTEDFGIRQLSPYVY